MALEHEGDSPRQAGGACAQGRVVGAPPNPNLNYLQIEGAAEGDRPRHELDPRLGDAHEGGTEGVVLHSDTEETSLAMCREAMGSTRGMLGIWHRLGWARLGYHVRRESRHDRLKVESDSGLE